MASGVSGCEYSRAPHSDLLFGRMAWRALGLALGLLALAWVLHTQVPDHAELRAVTAGQFFNALTRPSHS